MGANPTLATVYEKRLLGIVNIDDANSSTLEHTFLKAAQLNREGKYEECLAFLAPIIDTSPPLQFQIAIALETIRAYVYLSSPEQTKQVIDGVRTLLDSSPDLHHSVYAINYYQVLAFYHYQQAEYPQALTAISTALNLLEESSQITLKNELQVVLLTLHGFILWNTGDLDKAEATFVSAFPLLDTLTYTNFLHDYYDRFAGLNYTKGKYDQAEIFMKKSLELVLKTQNFDRIAASYNNLGIVYQRLLKFDEAFDAYFKAQEIREQQGTEQFIANGYINIASLYGVVGRISTQIEYLTKALHIYQKMSMYREMIEIYDLLGQALSQQGKIQKALKHFSKALELSQSHGNPTSVSQEQESIASTYLQLGNLDAARQLLHSAIAIQEEVGNASIISSMYLNLADVELKAKQADNARIYIDKIKVLMSDQNSDPLIDHRYYLAEGLFYKSQDRASMKFKAMEYLDRIIDGPSTTFDLRFRALLMKMELLILESKISDTMEIHTQIEELLHVSMDLCHKENRFSSLLQIYLFTSRYYLLSSNLSESYAFIDKAKKLVDEKEMEYFIDLITEFEDELTANLQYWKNLAQSVQSIEEKVRKAKIEDYLELVISKYSS